VTIELVDAQGIRMPRTDRRLEVRLEGPGRLLGLDNGLLDSEEEYASGTRRSSGGFCLAVVGRARGRGQCRLFARADEGQLEASIAIEARESFG
jgi:beta-galactosidase